MYSGLHDSSRWVLPAVLTEMADRRPGASWLTDSAGQAMTFGEAESQARRAASSFHVMGVARGDRVGIFMSNSRDFVRAWLGLGKLGARRSCSTRSCAARSCATNSTTPRSPAC